MRDIGFAVFVIYFSFLALFPVTHCHAAEALSDKSTCGTGRGPDHLPFTSVDRCCELHENGHTNSNDHHVHFLADNQTAPTRYNQNNTSPAPQNLTVFDEVRFLNYLLKSLGAAVSTPNFYQDALCPLFSGLSPPLS